MYLLILKSNKMEIVVYAQHLNHAYFYLSFFNKLNKYDEISLYTESLSIYYTVKYSKKFKSRFNKVFLIPSRFPKQEIMKLELDFREEKILNYWVQYFKKPITESTNTYLSQKNWIADKILTKSIGFCWSGNKSTPLAFSKAVQLKGGDVFYSEITNFPKSVYFDKKGTNYYASLKDKYKESIQKEDPSNTTFKEQLLKLKKNQKKIPQANLNKKLKLYFILTGLQDYLFKNGERYNLVKTIASKFKIKYKIEDYILDLIDNNEWFDIHKLNLAKSSKSNISVLVPLQVYSDTQLHVFSKYKSAIEFIKHIVSISDRNITIDIKLHPAENSKYNTIIIELIKRINLLYPNIKIVDTAQITDYDAVLTINSTFGIDALLEDVKVISFGESLYSGLDFLLSYTNQFSGIRDAIEKYDSLVEKRNFNIFAKILFENFYYFNYYGNNNIERDVDRKPYLESLKRIDKSISSVFQQHKQ